MTDKPDWYTKPGWYEVALGFPDLIGTPQWWAPPDDVEAVADERNRVDEYQVIINQDDLIVQLESGDGLRGPELWIYARWE